MLVPSLSTLTSFFEIFTVANLAYAGSHRFREFLERESLSVDSLSPIIKSKREEVEAALRIASDSSPEVNLRYERDKEQIQQAEENIEVIFDYYNSYVSNIFQPIFLMCGLFSLYVLIAASWASGGGGETAHDSLLYLCLSSSIVVVIFTMIVFGLSFSRKRMPRWPRPVEVILLLIVSVVVLPLVFHLGPIPLELCIHHNATLTLFWLTLFSAIAPYFLYFARTYIIKYQKRLAYWRLLNRRKSDLHRATNAIEYSNLVPGIKVSDYPEPSWKERNIEVYYRALKHNGNHPLDEEFLAQVKLSMDSTSSAE